MNRDLSGSYGSKKYAFKELVAEMNAAFCCASLGIVPTVRHVEQPVPRPIICDPAADDRAKRWSEPGGGTDAATAYSAMNRAFREK